MRKTYRNQSTSSYWNSRWEDIPIDEPMANITAYPLAYALKTVHRHNSRVLEVGCGPGRILRYFHQRGMDIVGLDYIAPILLRLKKEETESKLVAASALELPFQDRVFDCLLAFGVYHGITDISVLNRALREAHRVLDDDGLLCVSVRAESLHNHLIDWYKGWRARNAGNSDSTTQSFHKSNFRRHELEEALRQAGFAVLGTEPASNMTIIYQFRRFRANSHRQFDESLGRREGYKLAAAPSALYKFLTALFPWQTCNVIVSVARRVNEGDSDH